MITAFVCASTSSWVDRPLAALMPSMPMNAVSTLNRPTMVSAQGPTIS